MNVHCAPHMLFTRYILCNSDNLIKKFHIELNGIRCCCTNVWNSNSVQPNKIDLMKQTIHHLYDTLQEKSNRMLIFNQSKMQMHSTRKYLNSNSIISGFFSEKHRPSLFDRLDTILTCKNTLSSLTCHWLHYDIIRNYHYNTLCNGWTVNWKFSSHSV